MLYSRPQNPAAVTAAVMLTSLGPNEMKRVEFHANRPFVYFITERNSGMAVHLARSSLLRVRYPLVRTCGV